MLALNLLYKIRFKLLLGDFYQNMQLQTNRRIDPEMFTLLYQKRSIRAYYC